jgi:hypothetical protein
LILGQAAVDRLDSHETVAAVLTLLLGIALLALGIQAWHASPGREPKGSRASAIIERLRNVGPGAAFSTAVLLGFGGPKRLLLTFLAMASVSEPGHGNVESLALAVGYITVSTLPVSLPVTIVLIAGKRAAAILGRGQSWLTEHAASLRVWLSLGIGAALVVDAFVRLLA